MALPPAFVAELLGLAVSVSYGEAIADAVSLVVETVQAFVSSAWLKVRKQLSAVFVVVIGLAWSMAYGGVAHYSVSPLSVAPPNAVAGASLSAVTPLACAVVVMHVAVMVALT